MPNTKAFDEGYSRIFGDKKPVRGRFIQDETGKLVPEDEYVPPQRTGPDILPDITPYRSMATGEMITSRSRHREHLKRHGLIEVGNENPRTRPQVDERREREARKRAIADVLNNS